MTENLLTPSLIKLFGRLMTDLQFNYDPNTIVSGYNNLLQRQLVNGYVTITGTTSAIAGPPPPVYSTTVSNVSTMIGLYIGMGVSAQSGAPPSAVFSAGTVITKSIGPGNSFAVSLPPLQAATNVSIMVSDSSGQTPNFARIYGFSFEGAYYGLPRPSIFLVHGIGQQAGDWDDNAMSTLEQSGVAAREWDFSGHRGAQDIYFWQYEKGDFSIRLDPEAGPFEQILLQMALRTGADMADRATPRSGSGLDTRSGSGLDTRSGSGLDTRSGSGLRR